MSGREARARGLLYARELEDGREITVAPMTFGKGRLCIGWASDALGYDDGWCYATAVDAVLAATDWDGEGDPPDGWHRQISTGRRRENGDPEKEYQQW